MGNTEYISAEGKKLLGSVNVSLSTCLPLSDGVMERRDLSLAVSQRRGSEREKDREGERGRRRRCGRDRFSACGLDRT